MAKFNVVVITHYPTKEYQLENNYVDEDELEEEGEDVLYTMDYWGVTIEVNGVQVQSWGDHYHDKGDEKADGWVDGWIGAFEIAGLEADYEISYENRADYD